MFGKDFAEAWLGYADRAYVASRLLWFTGFFLECPVSAHRAIELYLKTFLVAGGRPVQPGGVWGHDLESLRLQATALSSDLHDQQFARRVRYFQRYFDVARYPSELEGNLTDGSAIWFAWDANILPLDQVVAFIRPRISVDVREVWMRQILHGSGISTPQARALRDDNSELDILLSRGNPKPIPWDEEFRYDLAGC